MEKEIIPQEQANNRHTVLLDCSQDEFVEKALDSVLTSLLPKEGQPSLLVADEYHMLTKEHKEELIKWVTPRLHWLKVVLIGNRSNGIWLKEFI